MTTNTEQDRMGTGRATGRSDAPNATQQRPRDNSPRGAGSGEEAVRRRAVIQPSEPLIPHAERVRELIAQAQDNEDANLAANEKQVEATNAFQAVMDQRDADRARPDPEDAPEVPDPRNPAVMAAQKAFREAQFAGKSSSAEDHAPGNNRTVQGTPAADAGSVPART